jgi:hypothetical protein
VFGINIIIIQLFVRIEKAASFIHPVTIIIPSLNAKKTYSH